jgi:putative heme transporter
VSATGRTGHGTTEEVDQRPQVARSQEKRPAWRRLLRAWWPWLRYFVGLGLAAVALWALAGRRGELSGATGYLTHLDWVWLLLAIVAEVGSLTAFGIVQQRLLDVGGVRIGTGRIVAVTFAVTAISNSMPAGPVLSSVFAFRQYRHQGADEAFAGWTLAGVFVAASVSLAMVAAAGLAIAGAEGAGFDLVWVTVGVLAVAVALGTLFLQQRALVWLVYAFVRLSRRVIHRPREERPARLRALVERLSLVKLAPSRVLSVTGWGVANWVLDCACLALSFMAVGVGVPWKALLLAYGAGQLAVNLPITPGGLGVVEGSLTIALVAFGGAETQTVAAVLLYRIISFWLELPFGWAAWGAVTWSNRRAQPFPEEPEAVGQRVAAPGEIALAEAFASDPPESSAR